MKRAAIIVIISVGAFFANFPPARACQICFPLPTVSAADRLLAADVVVLAREDPSNPFSLRPVEVLKGIPPGVPIDLFLDSATRRALKLDPELKIVCAYGPAGARAAWTRVGMADRVFAPLVYRILDQGDEWKARPERRAAYFAQFLGHESEQLGTLAHVEVARAPYEQIRGLGGAIPPRELHSFLADMRRAEWHGLYILLLAQSGRLEDRDIIASQVRSAARLGTTTQLAAWCTAWIEIQPEAALPYLASQYLATPQRHTEEVRSVMQALSLHGGVGEHRWRDQIVESYRVALNTHPGLAGSIAADLTRWERWDLADPMQYLLTDWTLPIGAEDRALVRTYIGRANSAAAPDQAAQKTANIPAPLAALAGLLILAVALPLAAHLRTHKAGTATTERTRLGGGP